MLFATPFSFYCFEDREYVVFLDIIRCSARSARRVTVITTTSSSTFARSSTWNTGSSRRRRMPRWFKSARKARSRDFRRTKIPALWVHAHYGCNMKEFPNFVTSCTCTCTCSSFTYYSLYLCTLQLVQSKEYTVHCALVNGMDIVAQSYTV